MKIPEGFIDRLIGAVDTGLKTVLGQGTATSLPDVKEANLTQEEKSLSVELIRINHAGEVCAQGLYEGQALVSQNPEVRTALLSAADEEKTHLLWCQQRLKELDGSTSVLIPLFYGMSVGIGAVAGMFGDRVSLGFVEATEDQVCRHLDAHLHALSPNDERSRVLLEQIRRDELRHGELALHKGGVEFPPLVKKAMTITSKVMTETTRHI